MRLGGELKSALLVEVLKMAVWLLEVELLEVAVELAPALEPPRSECHPATHAR